MPVSFDRLLVPPLSSALKKGDMGRIAVVGGSEEYTGAPYYAAISALRSGADLAFVLCSRHAAPSIKTYSPELIVHPVLPHSADVPAAELHMPTVDRVLSRVHAVVFGPGLSRDQKMQDAAALIFQRAQEMQLISVLDGDAIFMLAQRSGLLTRPSDVLLTPNEREFALLSSALGAAGTDFGPGAVSALSRKLHGTTVLLKGRADQIAGGSAGEEALCYDLEGSARRCGGQGDIVAGVTATFLHWCRTLHHQNQGKGGSGVEGEYFYPRAALNACILVRRAAYKAYSLHGRSVLATDILAQLGPAFAQLCAEPVAIDSVS